MFHLLLQEINFNMISSIHSQLQISTVDKFHIYFNSLLFTWLVSVTPDGVGLIQVWLVAIPMVCAVYLALP